MLEVCNFIKKRRRHRSTYFEEHLETAASEACEKDIYFLNENEKNAMKFA